MKNVITIEANAPRNSELASISLPKKRRVAGYARVSTDHEDQTTSYESQMKYYIEYISSRSDWEFVKMYSDEGISGTNTKLRVGFKSMIEDALAGKIDLIITKSVSRFARNTVDSLTTVRKLKEVGVEIYFEKENIWTLDSKGELLITIMSSLAQEESRSISENVTWGLRKQFAEGKVHFPYTNVMGFEKGENGEIVVNQEEAKTVRYIFQQALLGKTPYSIAKDLTQQGILSPSGKNHWSSVTIKRMLRNEKYKGDALLQKTYTIDFLSKKKNINKGELPQYYVENNHEAIVDREVFDLVQIELDKKDRRKGSTSVFSSKLVCGECGAFFGSKVWHSTTKYRRVVYRCNEKYEGESRCLTPHVTEQEIREWFVQGFSQLVQNKNEVLLNLQQVFEVIDDSIDTNLLNALETEMEVVAEMVDRLVQDNARVVQDQVAYQDQYNRLGQRYEKLMAEMDHLKQRQAENHQKKKQLKAFIRALSQEEQLLSDFDEKLWETTVEKMVIFQDKSVKLTFKNGAEVSV